MSKVQVRRAGALSAAALWFALAALITAAFAPIPARALDLAEVERDGVLVAGALELGEQGDWDAAQEMVAEAHPVVRDIILWRKLRAGEGSLTEYTSFAARRADWPGQSILSQVVGRATVAASGTIAGPSQESWKKFRKKMRRDKYDDAEAMLVELTETREALGNPTVWAKNRLALARRAAREGRIENAYKLASQHFLTKDAGYDYADCEWVAGWIALRKMNDPVRAITHFKRFRDAVETPISIGRGGYWLGRAYAEVGNAGEARRWFIDAARFQTSFYGQLAAAQINAPGDPQLTLHDLPDWRSHPVLEKDSVRMALTLHYAGEDRLAMAAFSGMGRRAPVGALAPLSRLAMDLGQPHYAVRVAKKAARRGVIIYPAYYPLHEIAKYATKVEPAFALSIARQETELNPRAISHAGARGLMQLMPRTAKKVAGWIGEEYSRNRLIDDWRYNVRLGETYLARRTEQFSGSYVMAAAAYNAGAGRVDQWNDAFGDPRLGEIDILDWMEQIPFNETRNYVQRVMEGLYVYRTRLDGRAGPMTILQDLNRGIR